MTYAAITGWAAAMPPAVLTNDDLSTFLDTNDEWIATRTGMRERRVSHVSGIDLAILASRRALACAGIDGAEIDLIVYGSCSNDEQVPNSASAIQYAIGAKRAASMDVNTACTSFLYALSTATALIRTGVVKNALVIGVEIISQYIDWDNRNVGVLFGDGCGAAVVQASDKAEGVLAEQLGCVAEARGTLRFRGMGAAYLNQDVMLGNTIADFDGQEIFKRAVGGMAQASATAMAKAGVTADQIDLVVPHQANRTMVVELAGQAGIAEDSLYFNIDKVGNVSAASIPIAIWDAVEQGVIDRRMRIFAPGFGAGAVAGYAVLWIDPATIVPDGTHAVSGNGAEAEADGNRAHSTTLEDVREAFN